MTTKGDIARFNTERERYGIGSAGQVLQVSSSLPTWATLSTADSVLTTQGDILYEGASALARLGFGTSGDVLTTKGSGANPVWETPSGGAWTSIGTDSLTVAGSELEVASFTAMDVLDVYYAVQQVDTAEPLLRTNDDSGGSAYITRKIKGTTDVDTTTSGVTLSQSSSNPHVTQGHCLIWAPDSDLGYTGQRMMFYGNNVEATGGGATSNVFLGGCVNASTTAITSIQVLMNTGDCLGHIKVLGFDY